MKRVLAILLCTLISTAALADTRTAEYKKNFYDNLQSGMIESIETSLIQQGFAAEKVKAYTIALKGRIDRQKLENSTWACVSKYTDEQLVSNKEQIAEECFSSWVTNLVNQNIDLVDLLK